VICVDDLHVSPFFNLTAAIVRGGRFSYALSSAYSVVPSVIRSPRCTKSSWGLFSSFAPT
jgi:hypothetical protein